jgi:hypothetical protein
MIRRPEDLPQKALFRAKPNGRRNQGRPKSRWVDGVNSDSLALGVRDGTHCGKDRQSWNDLLEQALTKYWLQCHISKLGEYEKFRMVIFVQIGREISK